MSKESNKDSTNNNNIDDKKLNPILHVVVVGFHHKKGCQVCKKFYKIQKKNYIYNIICLYIDKSFLFVLIYVSSIFHLSFV